MDQFFQGFTSSISHQCPSFLTCFPEDIFAMCQILKNSKQLLFHSKMLIPVLLVSKKSKNLTWELNVYWQLPPLF